MVVFLVKTRTAEGLRIVEFEENASLMRGDVWRLLNRGTEIRASEIIVSEAPYKADGCISRFEALLRSEWVGLSAIWLPSLRIQGLKQHRGV